MARRRLVGSSRGVTAVVLVAAVLILAMVAGNMLLGGRFAMKPASGSAQAMAAASTTAEGEAPASRR